MSEQSANPTTLQIDGMTCAHCAGTISKILQKNGATDPKVSFATGEALFELDDAAALTQIVKEINASGYKVVEAEKSEAPSPGTFWSRWSVVEKLFLFTLPPALFLFVSHMFLPHAHVLNKPMVQLIVCVPVFLVGLYWFGKSAWKSLLLMAPNMDVLIVTGSSAAFIYSVAGMILFADSGTVHNYIFFETSAVIINLVLLGNVMEHRSVKQTTTAIGELTRLRPAMAKKIILHHDKEEVVEVPLGKVKVGDLLSVNMGDKIPVDGKVITGGGVVDESMITGESAPVEKGIGSMLTGGTLLADGNFYMQVERTGKDTTLSRIITMVKQAELHKPQLQKLGDRVSNIFVPIVMAISGMTLLVSRLFFDLDLQTAMMNSIAVLVISCPCAMGLATPTAVMVGIGRAARKGILIKGGDSLEKLARVDTVVFDKTGTLTTGRFTISKIHVEAGFSEEEITRALYALEQRSSHPLALSLVKELSLKKITAMSLREVKEIKGVGMEGRSDNGDLYSAGSYRILKENENVSGHSVYILKNGKLAGFVDLQDEVRKGAAEMMQYLKKEKVDTVLLSGDTKNKCQAMAEALGIHQVYAEQLPDQKLNVIKELSAKSRVAMVGDGVNDAPALSSASIGISIGKATEAAIQSSQVVLLNENDLSQLVQAHIISKATLRTIKQNLFWAFFYNVLAIPLAAVGMLRPMMAALVMAFSDVIVVGNSITLKYKKLK